MGTKVDISGNVAEGGATQINNVSLNTTYTADDLDRACLHALRCPNTFDVKTRLREKDRLLHESTSWILQDPHYTQWQDDHNVSLLWIKGGAGKGKTMITIDLVEKFSQQGERPPIVTYFFCQNSDHKLNTIEGIIKGLIFCLAKQQKELNEPLRHRWDAAKGQFQEDLTSWRTLWSVFLEMLDRCKNQSVYVIVDALDECRDQGMAEFLQLIVRTGLGPNIKWLVTSRPLDSAERKLLVGSEQVMVSLELNSEHVAKAVKSYVAARVAELDRGQNYGPTLRQEIEDELGIKAEGTFLWVNLVCKKLETVCRAKVLTTIQDLPPGLHPFYHRIFDQLSSGESAVVKGCMRLLKVMLLVYRPLTVGEVRSVTGLPDNDVAIETLINRCASFVRNREGNIEFIHQSARDYLGGKDVQYILDSHGHYGHGEIALNCLSYLSQELKVNLIDLPRPDSKSESMRDLKDKKRNALLASVDYAATFWVEHLKDAKQSTPIQSALGEQGEVGAFLYAKLLEWLECLSLLNELPRSIEALKILSDAENWPSLSMLAQDATRFLMRHYQTIASWPLQTYSSALVFSPQTSVVKGVNLDKIPKWLKRIPKVEEVWASLIQTLDNHSSQVSAVAFSSDGKRIVSASDDKTIKLWDAITGDLQKTLNGHSSWVNDVAFSSDGKRIVSASNDKTIKLWDAITGDLQKTLNGHSSRVTAVAFSSDGKRIVSASDDKTIKLWDAITSNHQKTLDDHSDCVNGVAFSPDSKWIVSVNDSTIKLCDAITGDIQKTLYGSFDDVEAVAFSPDGKQIAFAIDGTSKIWDPTSDFLKTLDCHFGRPSIVAFSSDGKRIVSASDGKTIKLWDAMTGELQKTLYVHSNGWVKAVAFSHDGKRIAAAFDNMTIKLWDIAKSLKISKYLGSTIGSRLKSYVLQEIKTRETVHSLRFSEDGRNLETNLGRITIDSTIADTQSIDSRPLEDLWVVDKWIYYGAMPILRVTSDFEPRCFDTRGDQIIIGFGDGSVSSFDIDRKELDLIFGRLVYIA